MRRTAMLLWCESRCMSDLHRRVFGHGGARNPAPTTELPAGKVHLDILAGALAFWTAGHSLHRRSRWALLSSPDRYGRQRRSEIASEDQH